MGNKYVRLFCTFCTSWHCQPRPTATPARESWQHGVSRLAVPFTHARRSSSVLGTPGPDRTGRKAAAGSHAHAHAPPLSRPSIASTSSSTRQSSRQDKRFGGRYRRRDGAALVCATTAGQAGGLLRGGGVELAWTGRRRSGATAGTRQSSRTHHRMVAPAATRHMYKNMVEQ